MTSKVTIQRLATGVPGLDAVLGGGLPEFSFNLVTGPPGCGKTTLAHQIMFALATPQRKALYFTVLGEPPLKMLRYQQQFGFFDASAVNGTLRFVSLSEEALTGDLAQVLQRIVSEVEAFGPALVFVDSFFSMAAGADGQAGSPDTLRHFVQSLGVLMASWQATTFLIGEHLGGDGGNPVYSVADGIVTLSQDVQRNSVVRKMAILKMRGQATLPGLHTLRIGAQGVEVFAPPDVRMRVADHGPLGPRLSTGVATLDGMLDGGLPSGYSLLVAGPSGSGKSILASAFLVEGARCGETGVIAVFEQRVKHSRPSALVELIDSGRVALVDNRAPDLSIDEVVGLLIAEVRRLKATRVVIDSLSGFELALAPTFRADFRESLARLVTALAAQGVSVLMTSELEDRYTDLRFSPHGTAFLTDAIVVQRYIEVDSRLLRVMAVVKLRASRHSDELRLYRIDEHGIQIGATLPDHDGLLGGRPTRKPATARPDQAPWPRRRDEHDTRQRPARRDPARR